MGLVIQVATIPQLEDGRQVVNVAALVGEGLHRPIIATFTVDRATFHAVRLNIVVTTYPAIAVDVPNKVTSGVAIKMSPYTLTF